MKLAELIAGADAELRGDGSVEISHLAYDNRDVREGSLFICVPGMKADGHDFAAAAAQQGAVALIVERFVDVDVPQARVVDARAAMAGLAARWFDDPTAQLTLVGVTGTNGKTTTAFLVRAILERASKATGLLGTVKRVVGGAEEAVSRTTPEALDLQRTFRRMLEAGDEACVMEVSSHALALKRTAGLRFNLVAFTNLTQDHLDFHTDMEDYFATKRSLFKPSSLEGAEPWGGDSASAPESTFPTAVVNSSDPFGTRLADELRAEPGRTLITFSALDEEADVRARGIHCDARGSRFLCVWPDGDVEVQIPLPGRFNVENALCALAIAHGLNADMEAAAAALASVDPIPGRFEPIDEGQPFSVLVDYAHTPDSLENVLIAAGLLGDGRVISVFGCGGDRDRDKRPLMGAIGAERSDLAIVTSDNPRSEDPEAIIAEIVAGAPAGALSIEPDRRAAIAQAVGAAAPADTVVIAGKGHEVGQEFAEGRVVAFDDRDVARAELQRLAAK